MTDPRLRPARRALAFAFLTQGVAFALLVTRIPAVQRRYGVSDALLPAFLAGVPVLAGAGSLAAGALAARVPAGVLLRCAQPVVLLALIAVGAGRQTWQLAFALGAFGLAAGALDASMNMRGVGLQRACGRSIMLGFHAAYSLGGIVGALLAWGGAHRGLPLGVLYGAVAVVLLPTAFAAGRWYAERRGPGPAVPPGGAEAEAGPGRAAGGAGLRVLLPLCLVMACAYLGDSTVSHWSATYVRDVLGGSDALATVPYGVYTLMTLLGRGVGDAAVGRFGPVAVVRGGTVLAGCGFAVVAAAPGPWTGLAGFGVLGLGLSVIVPQVFAAAGRLAPGAAADAAVARLNVFTYVGFLAGAPLVGALGELWHLRGAMLVPLVLVLSALHHAPSFGGRGDRYGGGHERSRTVDVG
ncbi:MFS transporter [Streptomyces sp. CC53]|uniref:MFS transporter n=1 Tax=unclassified Streptomyces TaxID=2593676 RepID=UPI0008DD3554|nr:MULTISPECIES: MFS transporter [unclassified Streptomyces]OII61938.1 MFS transporter [Streptomyces sp. CC53]